MIRVAVTGMALSGTWQALQLEGWDETELQRLQQAWARIHLLEQLPRTLEVDRALGYTAFLEFKKSINQKGSMGLFGGKSLVGRARFVTWRALWAERDVLSMLQAEQSLLETLRVGQTNRNWAEMQRAMQPALAQLERTNALDQLMYPFSRGTPSNWKKATEDLMQFEAKKALVQVALALERHRIRHGSAPAELAKLVPEFLPELPPDPMNGQGLHYVLQADGLWTLYSVGKNGVDDGGDPRPMTPTTGSINAWGGKDIVWPRATNVTSVPPEVQRDPLQK
jgi:hypothetical protein